MHQKTVLTSEGPDCVSALQEKVNEAASSVRKVAELFDRDGRDKTASKGCDETLNEAP